MNGSIRDLSGASLDAERLRNARGLLALRAALTLAFLGVTVAAMSIDVQGGISISCGIPGWQSPFSTFPPCTHSSGLRCARCPSTLCSLPR